MIKINEHLEVEFPQEVNDQITDFSVNMGQHIKHLPPLEKFYALKMILEELDNRISVYSVMEMLQNQGINEFEYQQKTNDSE